MFLCVLLLLLLLFVPFVHLLQFESVFGVSFGFYGHSRSKEINQINEKIGGVMSVCVAPGVPFEGLFQDGAGR